MKNLVALLVISMLALSSCKKDATEVTEESETTVTDTASAATDSVATTNTIVLPMQPDVTGANPNTIMNQNSGMPMQQTTTAVQQVQQPVATAKGINPAHGQPGHNCAIAVGAPLNSSAKKASVASNTVLPVQQSQTMPQPNTVPNSPMSFNTDGKSTITTSTPTTPVETAPGMNPPHGQEGHVCAVAVGAPLPKS